MKAGAYFHGYKGKRSCRQKVRGCALNSVEHPHGGENHQHCETVDQILASSSTRLEGQKKRSAKTSSLIPESSTTADVEMAPRVHDIFNITGDDTGGDYTAIGSGKTCGPYTLVPCAHYVKPFTECQECSSHENSTPSLFACSESSYLKAYRDDKQRTSAVYSLSIVTGIQQVSRSRQRSR